MTGLASPMPKPPNIMQVVNESVHLKKVFRAVEPRSTRGHIHEAEAEPLKIGLEA